MAKLRIVLDSNVLVAGTRSRSGASFRVLALVGKGAFDLCLSVALVLEYESALLRQLDALELGRRDIQILLDYLAVVGRHQEIFFLWRPQLRDPNDDMVLELAVAARASHIVTHNVRDFGPAANFAIEVVRPARFLTLFEVPDEHA